MADVGFIPLDKAYLTAIWLETLLYGINICLFCSYVYVLQFWRTRKVSPIIFWVAVLMFCFSTIHVSLGFTRLIWGFIDFRDQPGGPGAFFSDVSQPPNVAKVTIHSVNSILGDSIVVWRCWHVWGRNWKVCIFPALLIVGSAVCGFGQAFIFANAQAIHSAFADTLTRWNGSLFILSLVTNVVVTTLIASRIWFISRETGSTMFSKKFRYTKVLVLIIESAMIYSAALVIEITLYFIGSNAFYIVYDPIAQLTAIVPTMIIVMSTLGLTAEDMDASKPIAKLAQNDPESHHLSTIHFQPGPGGRASVPGLTTGNTTTGFSDPTTEDSSVDFRRHSEIKLPEHFVDPPEEPFVHPGRPPPTAGYPPPPMAYPNPPVGYPNPRPDSPEGYPNTPEEYPPHPFAR
ncbi:hypothetical protein BD626DRAFT_8135 [Schizophyllum amplum]|uniref:Uncharacterized protein n=1 Tax=Schizophyllum amplum TaxID=97359 RepID=A0A550CWQ9_9AGAR|nr:hypothetical protein BD626DRAFT_8135 [Auriculariopsis ampla]